MKAIVFVTCLVLFLALANNIDNGWSDEEVACANHLKQRQVIAGEYVATYSNRLEACRNYIEENGTGTWRKL